MTSEVVSVGTVSGHPATPEIPGELPAEAGLADATVECASVDTYVESPPALGLRRSDRLFLMVLSALIVLLSTFHLVRQSIRGVPAIVIDRTSPESLPFQFDPNSASWVEWIQLPGIGETMARQIVEDIRKNGPFRSAEDLRRVKGIGKVKLEQIRPHLKFESPSLQVNPR